MKNEEIKAVGAAESKDTEAVETSQNPPVSATEAKSGATEPPVEKKPARRSSRKPKEAVPSTSTVSTPPTQGNTENGVAQTEKGSAQTEKGAAQAKSGAAQAKSRAAQTENGEDKILHVTLKHLMNIRRAPSLKAEIICTKESGTVLEVLEKEKLGWLRVKVNGNAAFVLYENGKYGAIG